MAEATETHRRRCRARNGGQPKFNPWLIAVVVALAAFMEVLDTSIANVALPHIAGDLGASNDQSTWVLTSYLASNAIVLPISGWLAGLFGRKRFFLLCIVLFTVSSLLCGAAPSLGMLILFRALQGVGGGGLQPMAQAILADTFPPQKRGLAFALYGITAVMAPTIGPTLGGWITDNYSWRWIFYINLPIGILALFLVYRMVEDPPYLRQTSGRRRPRGLYRHRVSGARSRRSPGRARQGPGGRLVRLALHPHALRDLGDLPDFSGGLGVVPRDPIIDVRLFKNFNFATANLMMFTLGVVYFSSLVMMPQFLQTLMGYTAQLAGLVLSASGVVLLLAMPIVGQLTTKIPAKYMIAFGWLLRRDCDVLFHQTDRSGYQLQAAMWLRVAQAVGLPFLFVPITLASYMGIPAGKEQRRRGHDQFHAQHRQQRGNVHGDHTARAPGAVPPDRVLSYHTTNYDPAFRNKSAGWRRQLVHSGTSAADAQIQAYGLIYQSMQAQAQTLRISIRIWCSPLARASCSCFVSLSGRTIPPRAEKRQRVLAARLTECGVRGKGGP